MKSEQVMKMRVISLVVFVVFILACVSAQGDNFRNRRPKRGPRIATCVINGNIQGVITLMQVSRSFIVY